MSKLQIIIEAVDQASAPLKKLRGEFDSLANAVKGMTDIGTAGKMAWGFVNKVGEFSQAVVQGIEQMQSMRYMMKAAMTDQADLGYSFAWVSQEASKLGIEVDTLTRGYAQFSASALRSGLSLRETQEIFDNVGVASRSLGLSKDRIDLVMLALTQMASKGKVSSEELRRQLAESLPGAFEIAAKSMGVTTAELNKMLQAGTVISKDFLPKFARTLRKEMGGAFTDAADGIQANSARMSNSFLELKRNWLEAVEPMINAAMRLTTAIVDGVTLPPGYKEEMAAVAKAGAMGAGEDYFDVQQGKVLKGLGSFAREYTSKVKELTDAQTALRSYGKDLDPDEKSTLKYYKQLIDYIEGVKKASLDAKESQRVSALSAAAAALNAEHAALIDKNEETEKEIALARRLHLAKVEQLADFAKIKEEMKKAADERNSKDLLQYIPAAKAGAGSSMVQDVVGNQLPVFPWQETPSLGTGSVLDAARQQMQPAISGGLGTMGNDYEATTASLKLMVDEHGKLYLKLKTEEEEAAAASEKTARTWLDVAAKSGEAFGAAFLDGSKGLKEALRSMLSLILDAIQALVVEAQIAALIKAGISGPVGWVKAIAEIAGISAAFGMAKAAVSKFPVGGDFMTTGPQMIMVGDNPGGRERVSVEPLSSQNVSGSSSSKSNVTIHIHNATSDMVDRLTRSLRSGELAPFVRALKNDAMFAGA